MNCWKHATNGLCLLAVSGNRLPGVFPSGPPVKFTPAYLSDRLRELPPAPRYWVAFSGGLDSTVLLHALARQQTRLGAELRAAHVNHHLNPTSDDWARHCARICAALHVPLDCRSVRVTTAKGESLEAAARNERYAVFRELLREGGMLLLAHQRDDQLETFLLQAFRGAGLRGLAAMPAFAACGSGHLVRPLLAFSRNELRTWAEAEKLAWLEDPSNADIRFDRNYLRQRIVPVIRQRWPSAAETVTRSARHCAETAEMLVAVAAEDWKRHAGGEISTLPLHALHELGKARAKNLLRYWLGKLALTLPPAHKLERIFSELLPARVDRNPCITWQGAEVRRYHERLYAMAPLPDPPEGFLLQPGAVRALSPGLGTLRLVATGGAGIRLANCPPPGVRISFRVGGEVCQPAGRAHRRPLKKWLQELEVVPWMRARLPLVYIGDELAAVVGLFVCAPFAAGEDEPGLRIEWQSHPILR